MSLHYNINITLLKEFEMETTIYFANQRKSNFCIGHLINKETYHIKEYSFWAYRFINMTHDLTKVDSIEELFKEFPCEEYDAAISDNGAISNHRYAVCAAEIKSVIYDIENSFCFSHNFPMRYYYMDNGYFCYASLMHWDDDDGFIIRQYDAVKVYGEIQNIVMLSDIAKMDGVKYTGKRFSHRVSEIRAISKTNVGYSNMDLLKRLAYNEYIADTGDVKDAAKAACNMINLHLLKMERNTKLLKH
jgi:hypothetical protein